MTLLAEDFNHRFGSGGVGSNDELLLLFPSTTPRASASLDDSQLMPPDAFQIPPAAAAAAATASSSNSNNTGGFEFRLPIPSQFPPSQQHPPQPPPPPPPPHCQSCVQLEHDLGRMRRDLERLRRQQQQQLQQQAQQQNSSQPSQQQQLVSSTARNPKNSPRRPTPPASSFAGKQKQQQQPTAAGSSSSHCKGDNRALSKAKAVGEAEELDEKEENNSGDWETVEEEEPSSLASRAAALEAANERLRADAELLQRQLALQAELLAEGEEAAAVWRPRLYRALVQAESERWSHERQLRQSELSASTALSDYQRRLADAEARAEAAERKLAAADRLAQRLQAEARRANERRAREAAAAAATAESVAAACDEAGRDWTDRLAEMEARLGRLAEATDRLAASEKLSHLAQVPELRTALSETRAALDTERQSHRIETDRLTEARDASEREQAKLAAALSQSERRLQRERDAAEARIRQAEADFSGVLERLRDRLRLVEGERNLLQAAQYQQQQQQSRLSQPLQPPRPHSVAPDSTDPKLHAAVQDLRHLLANSG